MVNNKSVLKFNDYIQDLDEGLLVTYPVDKVVKYIQNKLHLEDDDITVLIDQTEYIIVDKKLDDDILRNIEHIMKSSGYYIGGDDEDVIFYEKKFEEEVFDELKNSKEIKYLYHVSPSINDSKILSRGLIPKSKNYRFNYPDRIYFLSDKNVNSDNSFLKRICKELFRPIYINWIKMKLKGDLSLEYIEKMKLNVYSVYRIDLNNVENIKLYIDPNARNFESYYTMDNIKPEWIKKIDEIEL